MGIPARFPGHHIALHGPVTRNHILDRAGQYMADMRFAVGCGRTVIKRVRRTVLSDIHGFSENIVFFPELTDFLFSVYKVQICVNFLIHDCFLSFLLS